MRTERPARLSRPHDDASTANTVTPLPSTDRAKTLYTKDVSRFELERALRGVPITLATRGVLQALISRMDLDGTTRARPKVASAQQIAADILGPVAAGLDKVAAEKEAKRRQRLVTRHLTEVRRLGFLRRDGRSYEGEVAPWVACVPLDEASEGASTGHPLDPEGASPAYPLDLSGCQPEAPIPRVGTTGRHEWVPPDGTPSLPSLPLDRLDRRAREAEVIVERDLGCPRERAAAIVAQLAAGNPGLRNIAAFVNSETGRAKALEVAGELDQALADANRSKEFQRRRKAAEAAGDRCEHGFLDFKDPDTGFPARCGLCRKRAQLTAVRPASVSQVSQRPNRRSTA